MSQVVAIHWENQTLQCLVLRSGIARSEISAQISLPSAGISAEKLGQQLATALADHLSGHPKAIAALSRGELQWQHLSLPPCPAEELVDLVQMQTGQEETAADELAGFDFLPLSGNENTPRQVLAMESSREKLKKLSKLCATANLELARAIPLALGWPALVRIASAEQTATLYVAIAEGEATLWFSAEGQIALLRKLQLSRGESSSDLGKSLQTELQRTMLALSQSQHAREMKSVGLVGSDLSQLAELSRQLQNGLGLPVQVVEIAQALPKIATDAGPAISPAMLLPMAALAQDEAAGVAPAMDLLHPRRRPMRQIAVRTYALATAAALSICLLAAWSGYSALHSPLNAAATAELSWEQLEEELVELREDAKQSADIRGWLAQSANLLVELDQLSENVRPQPLDSEDFPADSDVVVSRLTLHDRQLTLEAVARTAASIQPFEKRTRESGRDIQRNKVSQDDKLPEYPWQFKAMVDLSQVAAPRPRGTRP